MDPAHEEIDFLARSKHRVSVMEQLTDGSCDRRDLRSETGASKPTMSRMLADLEDRQWIVHHGPAYELTPLGEFVLKRFVELREAMVIERKLRDVWQWLPREMEGFSIDLFADAAVSYPGPGYPYEPVERIEELIQQSRSVRGFGTLELKTANIETICGAVLDGLEMEYIFAPEILETTLAWDAERILETAACENCTLLVHDALPDGDRCGLSISDDRVAICCHNADSRTLTAVIDTAAPEARRWAVSVFEQYRQEATPIEEVGGERQVSSERIS